MKNLYLILAIFLINCTSTKGPLTVINIQDDYKDLIVNYPEDNGMSIALNFTRVFVKDTLKSNPKYFRYRHSADIQDSTFLNIIELYDERKIIKEKSELDGRNYYRLNHIINLYFSNEQNFVRSKWVADTPKEAAQFDKNLKKLLLKYDSL